VQRQAGWELPLGVLREALVHRLVQRDSRQDIKSPIEGRPSSIAFYKPAPLFGPTLTMARVRHLHPSRPGNKWLAKIFYLMGRLENWGGGTLKIIADSVQAGKPTPELPSEDGMGRLVLFRHERRCRQRIATGGGRQGVRVRCSAG
jgi:ATP-dependent DNA helicase RecG